MVSDGFVLVRLRYREGQGDGSVVPWSLRDSWRPEAGCHATRLQGGAKMSNPAQIQDGSPPPQNGRWRVCVSPPEDKIFPGRCTVSRCWRQMLTSLKNPPGDISRWGWSERRKGGWAALHFQHLQLLSERWRACSYRHHLGVVWRRYIGPTINDCTG